MQEVIVAVFVAILSYFVAIHFGCWCGIATFLILLTIYENKG